MKIYNYNALTRLLISEEEAVESPLEPGVFLIPAFATDLPPPAKVPEGKEAFFDGNGWALRDIPPPQQPESSNPLTDDELVALCKSQAKQYLIDTDWSQTNDVLALLKNIKDFTDYRATVRDLFFNPVKAPKWPTPPAPVWL